MLEVFAGCARLSSACKGLGLGVFDPIEIGNGAVFDVSRRSTQRVLLDMARAGLFAYVHLGTPCTVWSIARKGLTNQPRARSREQLGIEFVFFSSVMCQIQSQQGSFWSIENPQSSRLWKFEPIVRLRALPKAHFVVWDMCAYRESHKKPAALLTNVSALDPLGQRCTRITDTCPFVVPLRY